MTLCGLVTRVSASAPWNATKNPEQIPITCKFWQSSGLMKIKRRPDFLRSCPGNIQRRWKSLHRLGGLPVMPGRTELCVSHARPENAPVNGTLKGSNQRQSTSPPADNFHLLLWRDSPSPRSFRLWCCPPADAPLRPRCVAPANSASPSTASSCRTPAPTETIL